ncbi:tripartite tricarboxylate transporter TctB family protein [Aureimonas mangrovi]|uniref:tripartite tricarboxylate transporter TctB family protein n=1 Tax=Aureimonas mangrovi TaxID=2758041 RepID=UPI00163D6CA9|nr:tripartite tricarboxylate transporter TctB family protein [Aureimonas mangrovi]
MQLRLATKDLASGILFSVIGAMGAWWSFSYPMGTAQQMGPGYFPALVFGLLLALGLVIATKAILAGIDAERLEGWAVMPLLVILGSVLLFAYAIDWLGFVVASMGMILVSTSVGTSMGLATRLLLAACITALSWAIFVYGLGMLVPTWPEFVR